MAPDEELPDREQRVVQMLRHAAASERAPATLRVEVEALRSGSSRRPGSSRRSRFGARRPPWATPGGRLRIATVSVLPVAAALAVVLVLVIGSGSAPLLNRTAALAAKPAVTAGPGQDPTAPRLLTANVQNLHFPDWQQQGGWQSTGAREDQVGSHAVTTVYYKHAGDEVVYSIAAAPALHGSRPAAGQHYRTFKQGGRTYVVWIESGHTCVLSSRSIGAEKLWALARGQTV